MIHRRQQKRPELPVIRVQTGEVVSRQQTGEELLREVLGLVRRAPLAPHVRVKRLPVLAAQRFDRLA
jgi:hypothetical protein